MKKKKQRRMFRGLACLLAVLLMAGSVGFMGGELSEVYGQGRDFDWSCADSIEWMKHVDGSLWVNQVNIPGTHDSTTKNMATVSSPFGKCQDLSVKDQLGVGVRYFDLRINSNRVSEGYDSGSGQIDWNKVDYPADPYKLCHGDMADALVDMYAPGSHSEKMRLGDHVLQVMYDFLNEHPSEFLVVSICEEKGELDNNLFTFENVLFEKYINKNPDKWCLSKTAPTVDDARGKIVLLADYKSNATLKEGGLQILGLNGVSPKINNSNGGKKYNICLENHWTETSVNTKWGYISANLNGAANRGADEFILTYTNLQYHFPTMPSSWASKINVKLNNFNWKYGQRYGWVIIDFMDSGLARRIFQTNVYCENTEQSSFGLGLSASEVMPGGALDVRVTVSDELALKKKPWVNFMSPDGGSSIGWAWISDLEAKGSGEYVWHLDASNKKWAALKDGKYEIRLYDRDGIVRNLTPVAKEDVVVKTYKLNLGLSSSETMQGGALDVTVTISDEQVLKQKPWVNFMSPDGGSSIGWAWISDLEAKGDGEYVWHLDASNKKWASLKDGKYEIRLYDRDGIVRNLTPVVKEDVVVKAYDLNLSSHEVVRGGNLDVTVTVIGERNLKQKPWVNFMSPDGGSSIGWAWISDLEAKGDGEYVWHLDASNKKWASLKDGKYEIRLYDRDGIVRNLTPVETSVIQVL